MNTVWQRGVGIVSYGSFAIKRPAMGLSVARLCCDAPENPRRKDGGGCDA